MPYSDDYNALVDWRINTPMMTVQDWLNARSQTWPGSPLMRPARRNRNNRFWLEASEGGDSVDPADPGWPITQGPQDLPILPYPPPQIPPGFPDPQSVPVRPGFDLFGRRVYR